MRWPLVAGWGCAHPHLGLKEASPDWSSFILIGFVCYWYDLTKYFKFLVWD
jgi:hypothetical protein